MALGNHIPYHTTCFTVDAITIGINFPTTRLGKSPPQDIVKAYQD